MNDSDPAIERAANLIANAQYLVALTGAGVSTPSGIPDFRSPGTGLWRNVDPFQVASINAFMRRPADYYEWVRPLARLLKAARPNPAHLALAELERRGLLKSVITQNIDGLHQAAGSQNVLELHGSHREATCLRCRKIVPAAPLLDRVIETGRVPYCACGGVLKPNTILIGEMLPARTYGRAVRAAEQCDVMLVAGTSLEVVPASNLPAIAARHGAQVIMANREPTAQDTIVSVLVRGDIALTLPAIVRRLYPEDT